MENLNGLFSVHYLNFNSVFDKEANKVSIYKEFCFFNTSAIKMKISKELKEIFDDFYGGSITEKENIVFLENIPVRILLFKGRHVVAVGHIQNNRWMYLFKDGIFTEEDVVKMYIETYLKDIMTVFPLGSEKGYKVFESNPFEVCNMLNLNDVNPLDFLEVLKEINK